MSKKISFKDMHGATISGKLEVSGGIFTVTRLDGRTKAAKYEEGIRGWQECFCSSCIKIPPIVTEPWKSTMTVLRLSEAAAATGLEVRSDSHHSASDLRAGVRIALSGGNI
jgi:hypothetical protein